jgi:hypothetical protein
MEHCLKNITFEGIRQTYKNSYFLTSFHTFFHCTKVVLFWGGRYLTRGKLGPNFNSKLGSFAVLHLECMAYSQLLLELKNWDKVLSLQGPML